MGYVDDKGYTHEHEYGLTGDGVGLGLIGAAGLISAISTMSLLVYLVWHGFLNRNHDQPMVQGIRSFSRSALGVFLYCLLLSDMIQGAAFAINFKWASRGNVYPSVACTVQGSVSQVGDLGSALWSLAIAYHTFSLLFLSAKPPVWVTCAILISGWTLIIVLPIAGPFLIQDLDKAGPFYAISGAWCWVGDGYQLERFLYVYMWIFASLLTSLILYTLVYLRFSGRIVVQKGRLVWNRTTDHWKLSSISSGTPCTGASQPNSSISRHTNETSPESNGIGKHLKTISKRLMLYPLVYSVVTIPVTVCRFGTMAGWKPPFELYIFAGIAFSSTGLTNVILFIATRHSLLRRTTAVKTQIHVTTHQITVLDDANVQAIRLHQLRATDSSEAHEDSSEKGEADDASMVSKSRDHPLSSEYTVADTLMGELERPLVTK